MRGQFLLLLLLSELLLGYLWQAVEKRAAQSLFEFKTRGCVVLRCNMRRAMRCDPALGASHLPVSSVLPPSQGCSTPEWADAWPVSPATTNLPNGAELPEVAYDKRPIQDPNDATVTGGHAQRLASTHALRRLPELRCDGGFAAVLCVFRAMMPLLLYGAGPVSSLHGSHPMRMTWAGSSKGWESVSGFNLDLAS